MIISAHKYTDMVIEIKKLKIENEHLKIGRDNYKKAYEELLKCVKKDQLSSTYGKTNTIDFPATEKVHEDKIY